MIAFRPSDDNSNLHALVKLNRVHNLYDIRDEKSQPVSWETAQGRIILENCVHNATNYDDVIADLVARLGGVSQENREVLWNRAVSLVMEHYHHEHVKVTQEALKQKSWLHKLMQQAQVTSARSLTQKLDEWSDKIKQFAKLENSQRSLQTWNDTYRVQRDLVKKVLEDEKISPEILLKVNEIYSTRSVNRAVQVGSNLFDLKESEILKLVKSSLRYYKKDNNNDKNCKS
jgi:hypothetical protein